MIDKSVRYLDKGQHGDVVIVCVLIHRAGFHSVKDKKKTFPFGEGLKQSQNI